ncbi:hypothetical protein OIU76_000540 [Salix suchowensis]|nr:hypothetical protein OIU76_000540 [Salix suchowensis]
MGYRNKNPYQHRKRRFSVHFRRESGHELARELVHQHSLNSSFQAFYQIKRKPRNCPKYIYKKPPKKTQKKLKSNLPAFQRLNARTSSTRAEHEGFKQTSTI